jgi:hypothetical protein
MKSPLITLTQVAFLAGLERPLIINHQSIESIIPRDTGSEIRTKNRQEYWAKESPEQIQHLISLL